MAAQRQDESKRLAQHVLAKEIVELAHGAEAAKNAQIAHKEAFTHGTNTFSLHVLRNAMSSSKTAQASSTQASTADTKKKTEMDIKEKALLAYKRNFAASVTTQAVSDTTFKRSENDDHKTVTLPLSMLQAGSFPLILHAAGLASSKSEGHRLIANRGAYVVVPNSGEPETPNAMTWATIEPGVAVDPNHFLVDWEALVLRSGKSKIQICRVVTDEQFEAEGLTCPGWLGLKGKRPLDLEKDTEKGVETQDALTESAKLDRETM